MTAIAFVALGTSLPGIKINIQNKIMLILILI
jgi:hypothetical protein